jgi:hypothetical protein
MKRQAGRRGGLAALGASAMLPAVLAACAAQVEPPALPSSHPAHPAAAAAEPIRPSDLLERTSEHEAGEHEGQEPSSDEPDTDSHEHRHNPPTPPTERR